MAKMNIEIDTETKKIKVLKNNKDRVKGVRFKKISLVGEEDIRKHPKLKGVKGIGKGDFRPALIIFTKGSPGCVTYIVNGRYYYV
jgi:hypothetical protein